MATTHARLNGFVKFISGTPSKRGEAVRQAAESDYQFFRDFYLRFRQAIDADRRTTRDGAALEAAVTNADKRHAGRFALLAGRWATVIPRWDAAARTTVSAVDVVVGGLTLTVSASLAEVLPDGRVEIVFVKYNSDAISDDEMGAVLRVMQLAFAAEHPSGVLTFINLSTGRVLTAGMGDDLSRFDPAIEAEAAAMAEALRAA